MNKYLVVSYDDDQQQWFWDQVADVSEEAAIRRVCECRPYVIAADAIHLEQLKAQVCGLEQASVELIREYFLEVTR